MLFAIMAATLTNLLYHFVFSTKDRRPLIDEEIQQKSFSWQSGYGAFTVSESQFDRGRNYVRNQKDHHLKHSFKDELKLLVEKHRIAYDPKYLVD
jgi:hypothetical protein